MVARLRIPATKLVALVGTVGMVGMVGLTSACSGSSNTSVSATTAPVGSASPTAALGGRGTTRDPCSLLSTADVSAALQATVDPPKSSTSDGPLAAHHCIWASSTVPVRTFQLTLQSNADIAVPGETTRVLFDQIKTTLGAPQHLVADATLGADALVGPVFAYVLKGNVLLTADVGFGSSATAQAALVSLTAKAVLALSS